MVLAREVGRGRYWHQPPRVGGQSQGGLVPVGQGKRLGEVGGWVLARFYLARTDWYMSRQSDETHGFSQFDAATHLSLSRLTF